MRGGRRIAVVIPAHDEARYIRAVVEGLPAWVDVVVVVDDGSRDDTAKEARAAQTSADRFVVSHGTARGVGAAIVAGYRRALRAGADVMVVMAGDGQMDPQDLPAVVEPVVAGGAAYVKGDRLRHPEARAMPTLRRWGSAGLATLTSWAVGARVHDSQCGYTAITREALEVLDLDRIWPRYGYPNDLIARVVEAELTLVEVPVRPVYRDEQSGLRPWHVLTMLRLIGQARGRRLLRRGGR